MNLQRSVALLCAIALSATMLVAQQPAPAPAKRPITHQDYDSWRSILASQVSRDGKFVAGADGVTGATKDADRVTFAVGSGNYKFRVSEN